MSAPTLFGLAMRLALGECVTPHEARVALSAAGDAEDPARLERCARIKLRNEALRAAADELGGAGLGAWEAAGRLECAVSRFESRVWPRLKAGFECELCPSEAALHKAYLTGLRIPKTQRHLRDLLT